MELAWALLGAVREWGYSHDEWDGTPCVYIWRGPGRFRPVAFHFQMVWVIPESRCHRWDGSARVNVWGKYGKCEDRRWHGGGEGVIRFEESFDLGEPGSLDRLRDFCDGHSDAALDMG